jgi:hypothetical protein
MRVLNEYFSRRQGCQYFIENGSAGARIGRYDQFSIIVGALQLETFQRVRNWREDRKGFAGKVPCRAGRSRGFQGRPDARENSFAAAAFSLRHSVFSIARGMT